MLCYIFAGHFKLLELLLGHSNPVVRSRMCSMLGNCMKHSNIFYAVLHERAPVMQGLLARLSDDDPNVKRVRANFNEGATGMILKYV